MTTLPRIQIHDREHPRRTAIRIAFWLAVVVLLALLVRACGDERSGSTSAKPDAPITSQESGAAPRSVPDPSTASVAVTSKPKPPKKHVDKPERSVPATTPRGPSRTSTPSRSTATPHPPRTTPTRIPEPALPTPPAPRPGSTSGGLSSGTGTPQIPTPPSEPVSPSPVAPSPPSNHNCDATNEGC